MDAKAQLRARIKAQLTELPAAEHAAASRAACERLLASEEYRSARTICAYVSFGRELAVNAILEAALRDGKTLALPRSGAGGALTFHRVGELRAELVPGRYGIPEPRAECVIIPPSQSELLLVPGVAFTPRGERLGQGGGYYDRLLSDASLREGTAALAFELQIVETIPLEAHDAGVKRLITEAREWRVE